MSKHSHGHAGKVVSRTYTAWKNMHARLRSSYRFPEYYRDKGIQVCDRWSKFENFLADMGVCPPGLTLDREDGNENYCPDNCRWATPKQQTENQCQRKDAVIFEGKRVKEWAKIWGVTYRTAHKRILRRLA